jgi:hypothetical protein
MKRYDLLFLSLSALALTTGVSMGVFMAATHDFALMPVHAHLNLLGWTSLALFGLVHRSYPALAGQRLSAVHAALAMPSALLLPAGIWLAMVADNPALAILAALMWLAGCLVFLFQVLGLRKAT